MREIYIQRFLQISSKHRISHKITCHHTSQQDGIHERKHRHNWTGLNLLAQSHILVKYWVEAFHSAIYLVNRLLTPTIHYSTPFAKSFQQEPNYPTLKVFGCVTPCKIKSF